MKNNTISLLIDQFENKRIKYLRCLTKGERIILIRLDLVTMAIQRDARGEVALTEYVSYTLATLTDELDQPRKMVELALDQLQQLSMIGIKEGCIPDWDEEEFPDGGKNVMIILD